MSFSSPSVPFSKGTEGDLRLATQTQTVILKESSTEESRVEVRRNMGTGST